MIRTVVEKIPHLLVRQQDAASGRQRDAVRILPRHPPGAVQRQHGAGRMRTACGQRLDFLLRHFLRPKQRIAKGFPQPDLKLALLRAGQLPQIDPQRLGQLDEQ